MLQEPTKYVCCLGIKIHSRGSTMCSLSYFTWAVDPPIVRISMVPEIPAIAFKYKAVRSLSLALVVIAAISMTGPHILVVVNAGIVASVEILVIVSLPHFLEGSRTGGVTVVGTAWQPTMHSRVQITSKSGNNKTNKDQKTRHCRDR